MINSLQFIDAEGRKQFLTDGAIQGHYHIIGKLSETLYVCEGYATGASIHEATGSGVAVGFNAGNLEAVAKAIRQKHPDHDLVIAGDNDAWTDGNPGKTKAGEAAKAVNAKVALPQFEDTVDKPTDFNDLHKLKGLNTVREQLTKAKEPETTVSETNQQVDASKAIADLAELPPIEYERRRQAEANKLGIRVAVLDKEVWKLKVVENGSDMAGSAVSFDEVTPCSESVDGAVLINKLVDTFGRYVVLPEGAAELIALWLLHAHAIEAFYHTPRLEITSPEKQCGKTVVLDVLEALTPRSLRTENVTTAVLFRLTDEYQPTLLIDEIDTFLRDSEDLRGALNAGHRRGGKHLRCEGDKNKVRAYKTFTPVATAGIGRLHGTLADRAITITMRRALPTEQIEPFRADKASRERELKGKAIRWVQDNLEALKSLDPEVPASMYNRLADNWRPLFAIADRIGGQWPGRIREVATKLINGDGIEDSSARVQLLEDICFLFSEKKTDRIPTKELVKALIEMEERPWPEWKNGNPITQRQVALLLKGFGIKPHVKRIGDKTHRSYDKADFEDAFSRYLGVSSVTSSQSLKNRDSHELSNVTRKNNVTDEKAHKHPGNNDCYDVTDETRGSGKVVGVNI